MSLRACSSVRLVVLFDIPCLAHALPGRTTVFVAPFVVDSSPSPPPASSPRSVRARSAAGGSATRPPALTTFQQEPHAVEITFSTSSLLPSTPLVLLETTTRENLELDTAAALRPIALLAICCSLSAMADLTAIPQQELVDRLVTAVEESDVLYVVYWLQEMRRRGLLDSTSEPAAKGIDLEHSTLRYSALVSAVIKPHSELREVILLILLRFVRNVNHTAAFWLARSGSIEWAVEVLNAWDSQQDLPPLAKPLQRLTELEPAHAEAWIIEHLPPHPAPDTLTGYGPLPRLGIDPPSPTSSSSDSSIFTSPDPPSSTHNADRFESPATSLSDVCAPSSSPPASRQSSLPPKDVTARAPAQSAAGQPTPAAPRQQMQMPHRPLEIELGNLPLDTTYEEILQLFQHFRLNPLLVSVHNFSRSKSATLRVASEAEFQAASAAFQDAQLRGRELFVARLSHQPTPRDPIVILRNLPPSSRPQTLHDLVVQAKCGGYDNRIREQGQRSCMGVFRVPSEEAARLAVSRLNGLLVSGRKIRAEWRRAS